MRIIDISFNEEIPEMWRYERGDVEEFVREAVERAGRLLDPTMLPDGVAVVVVFGEERVEFERGEGRLLAFTLYTVEEGHVYGVSKRVEHAWGTVELD